MALVGSPIGKPWGQRLPVSVGAFTARTYTEFQAQVTSLATNGTVIWNDAVGTAGKYKTTAAGNVGAMAGSSWLTAFRGGAFSTPSRVIQHGLPSQAEFTAQNTGLFDIYIETVAVADQTLVSLNRNGYTSTAFASATTSLICTDLIYWDGTRAQRMNPNAGTGPTPYNW